MESKTQLEFIEYAVKLYRKLDLRYYEAWVLEVLAHKDSAHRLQLLSCVPIFAPLHIDSMDQKVRSLMPELHIQKNRYIASLSFYECFIVAQLWAQQYEMAVYFEKAFGTSSGFRIAQLVANWIQGDISA